MHEMFFGIKMVHLRILDWGRPRLRKYRLTPARFDMMCVIDGYEHEGIPQRNLQYLLGVSGPTVSRMLQSLEVLGFVERERMRDGRCLRVRITDLGIEHLDAAYVALDISGLVRQRALCPFLPDQDTAERELKALRRCLSKIRRAYGDITPFEEPWRWPPGEFPSHTCVHEAA